ncbi:MAG: Fic family protein [Candidatus Binataceae bacterium]
MDWDKFAFDFILELDPKALQDQIINIEAYREASLNLILPPDWREQLGRLNRARQVYGTTALEGSPLSEADVLRQIDILDEKASAVESSGATTKVHVQTRNSITAQAWVKERFSPGTPPMTCGDLLDMHRMITEDSDTDHNIPGRWRTFSVTVGAPETGGVHLSAPYDQLDRLMEEYVKFVGNRQMMSVHPVIRALLAHFFLVTIHPFGDGNGRVSRLVEAGILFQQGYNVHGFYGLSNYFYQHEHEYKTRLQACRNTQLFDVGPFVRFGIEGFAEELKGINNFIKTKLNRIVYRTMLLRAFNKRIASYRRLVNQREHNLLDFLLEATEPIDPFSQNPSRLLKFSELREARYVKGAYTNVTSRTFYRELNRLGELGFINIRRDESGKDWILELNFEAIGKY